MDCIYCRALRGPTGNRTQKLGPSSVIYVKHDKCSKKYVKSFENFHMCPRYFIIFHVYLTKSFNTIVQFVLQFKMFHFKSQNISQYFTMFLEMFRNNWHICCLQMLEWSVTAGAGSVTPGGGSMSARTPQLPARFPLVPARCLLGAGLVPVARLPLVPARLPIVTGCRLGSRAFLDYPGQTSSTPNGSISIDSPEL